jgi:hypothetical protein
MEPLNALRSDSFFKAARDGAAATVAGQTIQALSVPY